MKYRIEVSSVAEAEADEAFLRLSKITSQTRASQWYAGLLRAIESLSQMPKRSPLAGENEYFSQEIRQLLYAVEGATHTVSSSLFWKGKRYLRFAFCTFDTPYSKSLGRIRRNPTPPDNPNAPDLN